MRLIDADALVQMYEELKDRYKDGICCEVLDSIINDINNAPTIEPRKLFKEFYEQGKYDAEVERAFAEPSGDEYVPHKACFDCMERGTGMCKGTIQEQSWCPHVAKTKAEPSGDLISREWLLDLYDIDTTGFKETAKVPLKVVKQNIKDAPSISIQPKTIVNSCDLISREDAIEAVCKAVCEDDVPIFPECDQIKYCNEIQALLALPSADAVSREEYNKLFGKMLEYKAEVVGKMFEHKPEVADRPTDDLVSREAVVDTILETNTRLKEQTTINHLIENIDALPSAEPAPVVAYICDRRRCAICRGPDGGCDHTTDIKHAAHFKNVAGQYFERPYMEEEDDG